MSDDTCANPLLLGWIKEWLDQARERNTKGVTVCVHLMRPRQNQEGELIVIQVQKGVRFDESLSLDVPTPLGSSAT